jgi:hypothetical protein
MTPLKLPNQLQNIFDALERDSYQPIDEFVPDRGPSKSRPRFSPGHPGKSVM